MITFPFQPVRPRPSASVTGSFRGQGTGTKRATACRWAGWALLGWLAAAAYSIGQVQLDPLFTDHMVLQRGEETVVSGTCPERLKLVVQLGESPNELRAKARVSDGRWEATLDLTSARDLAKLTQPTVLQVLGTKPPQVLARRNFVWIGDVWIVQADLDYSAPPQKLDGNVTFCTVEPGNGTDPARFRSMAPWQRFSVSTRSRVPLCRVAFHLANVLTQREPEVPIGIIQAPWESLSRQATALTDMGDSLPDLAGALRKALLQTSAEAEQEYQGYRQQMAWLKRLGQTTNSPPPIYPVRLPKRLHPGNLPALAYPARYVVW